MAETIATLVRSTEGFVHHRTIVAALVESPALQPQLERLAAEDPGAKPGDWWASNFLQFFSKEITLGRSTLGDQFEREEIDGSWAYRMRSL